MIKKIDHFVLTTSKVDECIHFYTSIGFALKNIGERYELFAGDFKINVHMKGCELLPHAQNIQIGSADLCFEVDDNLDTLKRAFEAKGLTIELGIVKRTGVNGDMTSMYLRDPDGNLVEFCNYTCS